ncbi:protein GrpE [Methylopila jiangsuensis]|uniref:Protein GrpE n=1 Tax=Methylopila jiangsuensis TaxID=586230 RepID=A0A9W6N2S7_9HYPH|nr:nucleotide exchange factor GrpE [Methylopila jiangsuensis]MDR6285764.1 molecular chaperone GrpE [Methylopila jiangsuensis]GLK75521.1 protein GrpE [Methylopila jiangsuensis]
MPDTSSPRNDPQTEAADVELNAAEPAQTDGERADHTIEPEIAGPADRTAELEAAVTDLRDRFLRSHAEMENLRRRTEREVQDARKYALTSFARDLLSVADNLRRALEAVPAETDGPLKSIVDGVELTERELLKTLEKHGVAKIEPKGQIFDPNFHQAIFEAPDPSVPTGTVTQVVQDGYVIGDRLLRPAMVGVARGGPKPGEAKPEEPKSGLDRTA